ncbi:hypothetical protein FHU41_000959 [Psychromicrobium silvestre]|uniref:Uncharacterized protein n=1 Tax=Psychromicrobium silvestre TaxID=1645614 RepID=A0A7Y9LSE8_9MICC|nr:hypothetical protein [Psychromicrobium silvestre]
MDSPLAYTPETSRHPSMVAAAASPTPPEATSPIRMNPLLSTTENLNNT